MTSIRGSFGPACFPPLGANHYYHPYILHSNPLQRDNDVGTWFERVGFQQESGYSLGVVGVVRIVPVVLSGDSVDRSDGLIYDG